jgi:hypothetical protein
MDVEHAEMVEKQLDALSQRRARKGEIELGEAEELWKASVHRYNAHRREEMREAWASYHEGQAASHRATLRALVEHHEHEAAKLMDVDQKRSLG